MHNPTYVLMQTNNISDEMDVLLSVVSMSTYGLTYGTPVSMIDGTFLTLLIITPPKWLLIRPSFPTWRQCHNFPRFRKTKWHIHSHDRWHEVANERISWLNEWLWCQSLSFERKVVWIPHLYFVCLFRVGVIFQNLAYGISRKIHKMLQLSSTFFVMVQY